MGTPYAMLDHRVRWATPVMDRPDDEVAQQRTFPSGADQSGVPAAFAELGIEAQQTLHGLDESGEVTMKVAGYQGLQIDDVVRLDDAPEGSTFREGTYYVVRDVRGGGRDLKAARLEYHERLTDEDPL